MPSDNPFLRLDDMLENIDRIRKYTEDYTFDRFANDLKCQDAVERCLLRISEAARKLQGIVDVIVPDHPWSDVRAVGNVLRHEYDAVNPAVIWHIVESDLGHLKQSINKAIAVLREKKADEL